MGRGVVAVTLFRGPFHVMEWCDEETIRIGGRDGRGAPVGEMFPEPEWFDIQAAMDETYRSGRILTLGLPHGILVLGPRTDERGRVYGVASWFLLSPRPVDVPPLPTLPAPVLLRDQAG